MIERASFPEWAVSQGILKVSSMSSYSEYTLKVLSSTIKILSPSLSSFDLFLSAESSASDSTQLLLSDWRTSVFY